MATSGTATFNPDVAEIIEEAYERCGLEVKKGYDIRTARRSLNLLSMDWSNRGLNLWTVEEWTQVLTPGTQEYTMPADTVDLVEQVVRTGTGVNQEDIEITRIPVGQWATVPNKLVTGRPVQVYLFRGTSTTTIKLWPVPDSSATYTFVGWRIRRIQDTGNASSYTTDIPPRFIPAFVAGLAYNIALKKAPDRVPMLKELYEEQWNLAKDEDRDKSSVYLIPAGVSIR